MKYVTLLLAVALLSISSGCSMSGLSGGEDRHGGRIPAPLVSGKQAHSEFKKRLESHEIEVACANDQLPELRETLRAFEKAGIEDPDLALAIQRVEAWLQARRADVAALVPQTTSSANWDTAKGTKDFSAELAAAPEEVPVPRESMKTAFEIFRAEFVQRKKNLTAKSADILDAKRELLRTEPQDPGLVHRQAVDQATIEADIAEAAKIEWRMRFTQKANQYGSRMNASWILPRSRPGSIATAAAKPQGK